MDKDTQIAIGQKVRNICSRLERHEHFYEEKVRWTKEDIAEIIRLVVTDTLSTTKQTIEKEGEALD